MYLILLICYFFQKLVFCEKFEQEFQPIIGVLTQPSSWNRIFNQTEYSYIATSYIKYFENAGAKIIPIKYDDKKENIEKIIKSINGVLFPGGGTELWIKKENQTLYNLTEYAEVGKFIIEIAKKLNNEGIYFPIWGTCLGFELLLISESNSSIFSNVNSTNHSLKITYLPV